MGLARSGVAIGTDGDYRQHGDCASAVRVGDEEVAGRGALGYPRIGSLGLAIALLAGAVAAQRLPEMPTDSDLYCSGYVTNQAVPRHTYLITGEQSNYQITFSQGDLVYVNKGSRQGLKAGDEFLVIRPVGRDPLESTWFKRQDALFRAMGTLYMDLGRVRLVKVQPTVAIAEIVSSCANMQRGDLVQPFAKRPVPPFKDGTTFDRFAPVSGRPTGMVVAMKDFAEGAGANSIVYVNVGSAQDVRVGDYFRVFRYPYQAQQAKAVATRPDMAYQIYGFARTLQIYRWGDLPPREILGEGIVLRVSPSASTVQLTVSLREIYAGDYVEVE